MIAALSEILGITNPSTLESSVLLLVSCILIFSGMLLFLNFILGFLFNVFKIRG